MIGWLIFACMALVIVALLGLLVRPGKPAMMLILAALFVAAAGYSWQGSPSLRGTPAQGRETARQPDSIFVSERLRFLNRYGDTGIVLGTADALHRWNEDEAACGLLRNALRQHPQDVDLRIGYAHALFLLAHGALTPAVQLALDRAAEAAKPDDPRPAYFRGLVQLEAGDLAGASKTWHVLRAALPAGSPWATPMTQRLALLDALQNARNGGGAAPAP